MTVWIMSSSAILSASVETKKVVHVIMFVVCCLVQCFVSLDFNYWHRQEISEFCLVIVTGQPFILLFF